MSEQAATFTAATIFDIEQHAGKYFFKIQTCDNKGDPRVALRDLIFLYEKTIKVHDDSTTRTLELDAVFHQVLEAYPNLFNFIFKGLHDYHLDRSHVSYRKCMQL